METHNPHCYTCTNTSCIIKRNCHLQEMAVFLEHKSTIRCKKGQNFIIEGAPIHGLYFINHGKVKVAKTGLNGKEQIVRLTKDGDIIGHRGFGAGDRKSVV